MTQFYIQIGLQTIFFGLALYLYLSTIFKSVTVPGAWSKFCAFAIAQFFFLAMVFIGMYWFDTIETKNTFFSEPVPKLIEVQSK